MTSLCLMTTKPTKAQFLHMAVVSAGCRPLPEPAVQAASESRFGRWRSQL